MIKRLLFKLLGFGLFFLVASIISLILIISFRLSERFTMHLGILLGLAITILLQTILVLSKIKRKVQVSTLIKNNFATLLFLEMFILIISPLHSLLPEKVLLKTGILKNMNEIMDCAIQNELTEAKDFMQRDIDLSKVKIYYGGDADLASYFKKIMTPIKATAWGNFIYVSRDKPCITGPQIVHELTHVWQYQHGYGFGIKWLYLWPYYYWNYLTNFESLYDFGSYEGLIKSMSNGIKFEDFGLEQQARIVQTYYLIGSVSDWNPYLEKLEEFKALKYFISQEFSF